MSINSFNKKSCLYFSAITIETRFPQTFTIPFSSNFSSLPLVQILCDIFEEEEALWEAYTLVLKDHQGDSDKYKSLIETINIELKETNEKSGQLETA